MCGIAGILNTRPASMGEAIHRMTEALAHRGPDDHGYVSLDPGRSREVLPSRTPPDLPTKVWLGHRRLSIIDLTASRQPLANEDGTAWVVFNGEIYNYKALRTNLSGKGHRFRTDGDTEVLVHLWEDYGEEMLDHLVGMFSFALYDTRRDILFAARDRFGQKPLFYWHNKNRFAFASELQSLWTLEDFPGREVDAVAACQYFRYGFIPSPRTIFSGVRALPPGHYLTLNRHSLVLKEYWRPVVRGTMENDGPESVQRQLDEATRDRLQSDVPLGAFLSGGIDSSLIVASMRRHAGTSVETFTVSMGNSFQDESDIARLTANHLRTHHHELQVTPDVVDTSRKLAGHFGQPFADYSSIPTYYISRATRKHVTVALSGDGGDELFGGYRRYPHYRWSVLAGKIPFEIRKGLVSLFWKGYSPADWGGDLMGDFLLSAAKLPEKGENHSSSFHDFWQHRCFQPDLLSILQHADRLEVARFSRFYEEAVSGHPLERWLEVDQRLYLPEDILTKVDIASMAVSLECRCPLLDHRLAESVNQLPIHAKIQGRRTKILLRRLASRQVPTVVSTLPKTGFVIPLATWLRNGLKEWSYDILFQGPCSWEDYLKPKAVQTLWNEHQSGCHDHSKRLWTVIAWVLWTNAVKQSS